MWGIANIVTPAGNWNHVCEGNIFFHSPSIQVTRHLPLLRRSSIFPGTTKKGILRSSAVVPVVDFSFIYGYSRIHHKKPMNMNK
jgi:hypothetical protein